MECYCDCQMLLKHRQHCCQQKLAVHLINGVIFESGLIARTDITGLGGRKRA